MVVPWAYMEPLPPLPGKGLASVTKWRRSQNEKGEEERKKEEKKGKKKKRKREKRKKGRERGSLRPSEAP